MNLNTPIQKKQLWTTTDGARARGPALICLTGAGESGKTRLACCAPRACPGWFGKRAVYIAIDPEAASLGPVLQEDRKNLIVVTPDLKQDIFAQLMDIYSHDWAADGATLCITDTMTILTQLILAQVTNSGRFSERHIDLGHGIKQPMQGDFLATMTLTMSLLRKQQQSGMHHISLFHEQEVRPEPGQPGDPIGGPATVGKASIRSIVNWYNTVLHVVRRPKKRTDINKPLEYERIVHTASHGHWQAKLRTSALTNPIPEVSMDSDPVNVWRTLESTTFATSN